MCEKKCQIERQTNIRYGRNFFTLNRLLPYPQIHLKLFNLVISAKVLDSHKSNAASIEIVFNINHTSNLKKRDPTSHFKERKRIKFYCSNIIIMRLSFLSCLCIVTPDLYTHIRMQCNLNNIILSNKLRGSA